MKTTEKITQRSLDHANRSGQWLLVRVECRLCRENWVNKQTNKWQC